MNGESRRGVIRFASFEVDLRSGELYKGGHRIRIEAQPLKVLSILLETPREVVSRQTLKERLWPQDTFVNFDHGLNVDIQRLRVALGDSAENPKFIETLPRRGYRFIYPLEHPGETASAGAKPTWKTWRKWGWLALAASLVIVAGYWIGVRSTVGTLAPQPSAIPLTAYPGREWFPSFSPDGNLLAFCWNGEKRENWDIYIRQIGTDSLRRLTTHPAMDFCPVFSPDGRRIAFLRGTGVERATVFLMPVNGGPEQALTDVVLPEGDLYIRPGPYLTWLPDGERLIIVDKNAPQEPSSLWLFPLSRLRRTRLTKPPPAEGDDDGPAVSPNGKWLAFSRGLEASHLYLVELSGDQPRGTPVRITSFNEHTNSPAWTPDGREILFSMGLYQEHSLWRVPLANGKAGTPQRLEYAGVGVWHPTLSRHGNRLAFARWLAGGSEIWKLDAPGPHGGPAIPSRLIFSTRDDEEPEYSPDGRQIVFKSNRSGRLEIWVCREDGSEPLQLTFRIGENTFLPRWSPDGRRILFTSNPDGNNDLFIVASQGGAPQRLTRTPFNEVAAVYSRDGSWIYYHSDQSGQKQIWKMPVDVDGNCGTATRVTSNGGISPEESPDGRFLYFLKEGSPRTLWRMPATGGLEVQVLPSLLYDNYFAADDGIYFVDSPSPNRFSLGFCDYVSMRPRRIFEPADPGWGLAVSPMIKGTSRSILYVNCRPNDSDLMLVNDFR